MPSTFTWIDHAERDRERMMAVIDLFAEQDTRDELGIGGVRDSPRLVPILSGRPRRVTMRVAEALLALARGRSP